MLFLINPWKIHPQLSTGISINVSLRSQKNHIIFEKLSKTNWWRVGDKLGLKCPLVPFLKVIINSHLAYNMAIHLDPKF